MGFTKIKSYFCSLILVKRTRSTHSTSITVRTVLHHAVGTNSPDSPNHVTIMMVMGGPLIYNSSIEPPYLLVSEHTRVPPRPSLGANPISSHVVATKPKTKDSPKNLEPKPHTPSAIVPMVPTTAESTVTCNHDAEYVPCSVAP